MYDPGRHRTAQICTLAAASRAAGGVYASAARGGSWSAGGVPGWRRGYRFLQSGRGRGIPGAAIVRIADSVWEASNGAVGREPANASSPTR